MAVPLRAPAEDGAILAIPPLGDAGRLLADTRTQLQTPVPDLSGRSLADLRRLARSETLAEAGAFHAALDLPIPPSRRSEPLIAFGHQPELFHPGVWIKHFAAHRLAETHNGCSVNVLIDSDVVKSATIAALARHDDVARVVRVPFDRWTGPAVFEERQVLDEALFDDFPNAVASAMAGLGIEPILPRFWPDAVLLRDRTPLLGLRLAGARRRWEERLGCRNWEVPMSRLARTESFAWFACHVLADLGRFQEAHNRRLAAFRTANRVRQANRPMPDLTRDGEWFEAPFWVWRAGAGIRNRLFARRSGGDFELRMSTGSFARLPGNSTQAMVDAWRELEANGYKLRTRALTSTLFLRLLVADIFIHGIGGAIYDRITDGLIEDFYRLPVAPGFFTISATLRLPLALPGPTARSADTIARQLRDLHFNPDRHLPAEVRTRPDVEALLQTKRRFIDSTPRDRVAKRERFHQLRDIGEGLRTYVTGEIESTRAEYTRAKWLAESEPVTRSREYAFCLHPDGRLRELIDRLGADGATALRQDHVTTR